MIGIINTGEVNEAGEHRYRLQINQWLKGEFHHKRSDGLAVCLEKAAICARIAEQQEQQSDNQWLAHIEKLLREGDL